MIMSFNNYSTVAGSGAEKPSLTSGYVAPTSARKLDSGTVCQLKNERSTPIKTEKRYNTNNTHNHHNATGCIQYIAQDLEPNHNKKGKLKAFWLDPNYIPSERKIPWGKHPKDVQRYEQRHVQKRKESKERREPLKKFDSTSGYPGEGPGHSQRMGAECDIGGRCMIAGHYHRKAKNSKNGAARRIKEKTKSKGGNAKIEYELCTHLAGESCPTCAHYHDLSQTMQSKATLMYIRRRHHEEVINNDAMDLFADDSDCVITSDNPSELDSESEMDHYQHDGHHEQYGCDTTLGEGTCPHKEEAQSKTIPIVIQKISTPLPPPREDKNKNLFSERSHPQGEKANALAIYSEPAHMTAVAADNTKIEHDPWLTQELETSKKCSRVKIYVDFKGGDIPEPDDTLLRSFFNRFGYKAQPQFDPDVCHRSFLKCTPDLGSHLRFLNFDLRSEEAEVVVDHFVRMYPTYYEGLVYDKCVQDVMRSPELARRRAVNKDLTVNDVVTAVKHAVIQHPCFDVWSGDQRKYLDTVCYLTNLVILRGLSELASNPSAVRPQYNQGKSFENVVTTRLPFRLGVSQCSLKSLGAFVYNNMFTVLSGAEHFVDGVVSFPNFLCEVFSPFPDDTSSHGGSDGSYRTVFGPSVAHNGIIYGNSDHNVSLAFSRLTAVRKPEIPGEHDRLKRAQSVFIRSRQDLLDFMRHTYAPHFSRYLSAENEAEEHHADTHAKKALRIQAWKEIGEDATRYSRLWVKKVLYKMKKNEIAKPGKVPRMIGDLGVAASLQGAWVTKLLKTAQAMETIHYKGGEIEFIATPQPSVMERVFNKLMSPPGRYYMALFSDDSCFSIRTDKGVDIYNVDISKCDASHTDELFEALIRITPEPAQEDMRVLTEQCELPITIRSVEQPMNRVVLQPKHRVLYSGSTLTTAINNLASTLIGVSFADCEYKGPASLTEAAATVGYIITLDKCQFPEDIQFLKHSPCLDVLGVWRPLLNLGVLLRLSGACDGDLPGRGDISQRANRFQGQLMRGAYPRAIFEIHSNLTATAGPATGEFKERVDRILEGKVIEDDYLPFEVDPVSMYKRYRLDDLEISDLLLWSRSGYTGVIAGTAVDKVLGKDYGLASNIEVFTYPPDEACLRACGLPHLELPICSTESVLSVGEPTFGIDDLSLASWETNPVSGFDSSPEAWRIPTMSA